MFVSLFINPETGSVSLQHSTSKDFGPLENTPSFVTIEAEGVDGEYLADKAYMDVAKHLWKKLGDTPTDEDGVDGAIDEDFLIFKKGEEVYEIWNWLESEFNVSIGKDLMFA